MRPTLTAASMLAILALASAALLGACGPKGGGAAPSGSGVEIKESDLPRQRAGLWKTIRDDGGGKPTQTTTCLSGKVPSGPEKPPGCSSFTIRKTAQGAYMMDMNCATPNSRVVAHAVATGDFQSHIAGDTTMTLSAQQGPARTVKMHTEAIYLGPCPPGQKPDDDGATAAK